MKKEALEDTQGVRAPSKLKLELAFQIWARENEGAWSEMSVYEKVLKCSQLAAEEMFGADAKAHTDGANYFSVRVSRDGGEADSLYFGRMGGAPDYFMRGSSVARLKPAAQVLDEMAGNMSAMLGGMLRVDAREAAGPDAHPTLQQLFIANDAASIMAVAATSIEDELDGSFVFLPGLLWSHYTEICQAESKPPRAYISLLGANTSFMPMSELQNPEFDNPHDLEWRHAYDAYDIARMPVSNLTLKHVDEDVAAGLVLADLVKVIIWSARSWHMPKSARLRTAALLEDRREEIRQRMARQMGSNERLSSLLAQEREEFLKEA